MEQKKLLNEMRSNDVILIMRTLTHLIARVHVFKYMYPCIIVNRDHHESTNPGISPSPQHTAATALRDFMFKLMEKSTEF